MSSLHLIRHGQAGRRGHYDALSDLGQRQAYLLGQYLAAQNVPFKAFIAGCLNRQRQTAAERPARLSRGGCRRPRNRFRPQVERIRHDRGV